MSDQLPEDNHALTEVLNRINALMKHGEPSAEAPPVSDEAIPVLTEVYEGEPLTFTSHAPQDFPTLDQVVSPVETITELISVELVDALLAEMLPFIRVAVKKAVQQELENAEQSLGGKLEAELMQSLRERLQSRIP